jgi:anti-anti-sigma factor
MPYRARQYCRAKVWYLSQSMALQLTCIHIGKVAVVRCRGRITTGEETRALEQEVARVALETKNLILNLSEVNYMDSGALGLLVRLFRSLRTDRGDLKICEVPAPLFKVIQTTHLNTVLEIFEMEAQAVEAFRYRPVAQEGAQAAGRKLLCVDESADVLAYLGVLLRRSGYEVLTTQKVPDFARLLKATQPDAVVAGQGIKANAVAAEVFRRAGPNLRVLFLPSEFSSSEASEAGREIVDRLLAAFREPPSPGT